MGLRYTKGILGCMTDRIHFKELIRPKEQHLIDATLFSVQVRTWIDRTLAWAHKICPGKWPRTVNEVGFVARSISGDAMIDCRLTGGFVSFREVTFNFVSALGRVDSDSLISTSSNVPHRFYNFPVMVDRFVIKGRE